MFDFLARLLAACYDFWPSFGGAIALLTVAIMLVLTPLSIKSTRSMIKLQRLQPELKRLQAQHKGDREALNREMMAFYQANNVNPFSSCLPMLLQFPVFIVLYRILSGLTATGDGGGFAPKYLDKASHLYQALEGRHEMKSFGMDLARSALTTMNKAGVPKAMPVFIMVGFVGFTTWYQQRQIQGRNPQAAAANPQQQMITKLIPIIMLPLYISLPAGVVIYFLVSNLMRVGQQGLISFLEFRGADGVAATTVAPPAPKPKPSPADKALPKRTTPGGAGRNPNSRKRKRK